MTIEDTTGAGTAPALSAGLGAPRLRKIQQSRNTYLGRYKGHVVDVSRDTRSDDWYIIVTAPNGCYSYDGWWRDSAGKTKRAAILEALHGAMLWAPTAEVTRG